MWIVEQRTRHKARVLRERKGYPTNIRQPAANDFERLRTLCPQLQTVGFNGQASGKFAPQFAQAGYRTVVLPSSSLPRT